MVPLTVKAVLTEAEAHQYSLPLLTQTPPFALAPTPCMPHCRPHLCHWLTVGKGKLPHIRTSVELSLQPQDPQGTGRRQKVTQIGPQVPNTGAPPQPRCLPCQGLSGNPPLCENHANGYHSGPTCFPTVRNTLSHSATTATVHSRHSVGYTTVVMLRITCLWCKPEDPSLIPTTHLKSWHNGVSQ